MKHPGWCTHRGDDECNAGQKEKEENVFATLLF